MSTQRQPVLGVVGAPCRVVGELQPSAREEEA